MFICLVVYHSNALSVFIRRRKAARQIALRTLMTTCCAQQCFKVVPDTEFMLNCLLGCVEEVEGLSQHDKKKYLTEKLAGKFYRSLNWLSILTPSIS